jgi:hypothetical protein
MVGCLEVNISFSGYCCGMRRATIEIFHDSMLAGSFPSSIRTGLPIQQIVFKLIFVNFDIVPPDATDIMPPDATDI